MPPSIWDPVTVGDVRLPHRLAMAPMTRNRATADGVPTPLNAEYYGQRASLGLLITEGTQPSEDGQGYLLTPGIHTPEQVAGWRQVIEAVHAGGGRVFMQIMHAGRVCHPDNTPHHRQPVAPSAVAPGGTMFTAGGMKPMPEPRALTTDEAAAIVQDFRRAARRAIEAGADGVEIHGANGYLVHQFLSSNTNRRTDRYGGSIENRIRFAVEVASAIADEIGAGRLGIHISPGNPFNDIVEDDTAALYPALVAGLAPLGMAYLHQVHGGDDGLSARLREAWPTAFLLNRPDADLAARIRDVEEGRADVTTIGKMALANPDLVDRARRGASLNAPDPTTFFGGDRRGYTDYPPLAERR